MGVVFLGLLIGLARHGTAAGVQIRGEFYAIAAASYAMSFPVGRKELDRLLVIMAGLASFLMLVCAYRWTVFYGNLRDLLPDVGTYNIDGDIRVVGATAALVLGQALVLGAFHQRLGASARPLRWLLPLLLAVVLVLQHRSVWLAVLVGVATSLILGRAAGGRALQLVMLAGLALLVGLAMSLGGTGYAADPGLRATRRRGPGHCGGTFRELAGSPWIGWIGAGPRAIVLGREPGSDMTRLVDEGAGKRRYIGFGAHNSYVTMLTGTGVLGMFGILWAMAAVLRRLYARLPQRAGCAAGCHVVGDAGRAICVLRGLFE